MSTWVLFLLLVSLSSATLEYDGALARENDVAPVKPQSLLQVSEGTGEVFTMAILNAITYVPLWAFASFAEWYDNRQYRKKEKELNTRILKALNSQCALLMTLRQQAVLEATVEDYRMAALEEALAPVMADSNGMVDTALTVVRYLLERNKKYLSQEVLRAGCADTSASIVESEEKLDEYLKKIQSKLENEHTVVSQIVDIAVRFGFDMGIDKAMEHLTLLIPGMNAGPGTAPTTVAASILAPTLVIVGNLINFIVMATRMYQFAVDAVAFWDKQSLLEPQADMIMNDVRYATCMVYASSRTRAEQVNPNYDIGTRIEEIQKIPQPPLNIDDVTPEFISSVRRNDMIAAERGMCKFLSLTVPLSLRESDETNEVLSNWVMVENALKDSPDTLRRIKNRCESFESGSARSGFEGSDFSGRGGMLEMIYSVLREKVNNPFDEHCEGILQVKTNAERQPTPNEPGLSGQRMSELKLMSRNEDKDRYPISDVVVTHFDAFIDEALKRRGFRVIEKRYPFLNVDKTFEDLKESQGRCAEEACTNLPHVSSSLFMHHCGAQTSSALMPMHCRTPSEAARDMPPQPIIYVRRSESQTPVTSVAAWGVVDTKVKTKEKEILSSSYGRLVRLAQADYEYAGMPCSLLRDIANDAEGTQLAQQYVKKYNELCKIGSDLYPVGDEDYVVRTNVNEGCGRHRKQPVRILVQRSNGAPLDDIAVTTNIGCVWGPQRLHVVDSILKSSQKDGSRFYRDEEEIKQPTSWHGIAMHLWNKKTYKIFAEDVIEREQVLDLDNQLAVFSDAPMKLRYRCEKAVQYMGLRKMYRAPCGDALEKTVSVGPTDRYAFDALYVARPGALSFMLPNSFGKLYVFWGFLAWRQVILGRTVKKVVIPFEDINDVRLTGMNSITIDYIAGKKPKSLTIGGFKLSGKYRRKLSFPFIQAVREAWTRAEGPEDPDRELFVRKQD